MESPQEAPNYCCRLERNTVIKIFAGNVFRVTIRVEKQIHLTIPLMSFGIKMHFKEVKNFQNLAI